MAYDLRKKPGAWVTARARHLERRAWAMVVAFLIVITVVAAIAVGSRSALLSGGLLAAVLLVRPFLDARVDEALRWLGGARAEAAIGELLETLPRPDYVVMHDIEQKGEGNIDHLVSGPSGVFMIETKRRRYEVAQLTKAKRQAAKLAGELGVWVTPVISLAQPRPRPPFRHDRVWIVPQNSLIEWIQAQHNATLPFEKLARFADNL